MRRAVRAILGAFASDDESGSIGSEDAIDNDGSLFLGSVNNGSQASSYNGDNNHASNEAKLEGKGIHQEAQSTINPERNENSHDNRSEHEKFVFVPQCADTNVLHATSDFMEANSSDKACTLRRERSNVDDRYHDWTDVQMNVGPPSLASPTLSAEGKSNKPYNDVFGRDEFQQCSKSKEIDFQTAPSTPARPDVLLTQMPASSINAVQPSGSRTNFAEKDRTGNEIPNRGTHVVDAFQLHRKTPALSCPDSGRSRFTPATERLQNADVVDPPISDDPVRLVSQKVIDSRLKDIQEGSLESLQAICGQLGLDKNGTKGALRGRALAALKNKHLQDVETNEQQNDMVLNGSRTARRYEGEVVQETHNDSDSNCVKPDKIVSRNRDARELDAEARSIGNISNEVSGRLCSEGTCRRQGNSKNISHSLLQTTAKPCVSREQQVEENSAEPTRGTFVASKATVEVHSTGEDVLLSTNVPEMAESPEASIAGRRLLGGAGCIQELRSTKQASAIKPSGRSRRESKSCIMALKNENDVTNLTKNIPLCTSMSDAAQTCSNFVENHNFGLARCENFQSHPVASNASVVHEDRKGLNKHTPARGKYNSQLSSKNAENSMRTDHVHNHHLPDVQFAAQETYSRLGKKLENDVIEDESVLEVASSKLHQTKQKGENASRSESPCHQVFATNANRVHKDRQALRSGCSNHLGKRSRSTAFDSLPRMSSLRDDNVPDTEVAEGHDSARPSLDSKAGDRGNMYLRNENRSSARPLERAEPSNTFESQKRIRLADSTLFVMRDAQDNIGSTGEKPQKSVHGHALGKFSANKTPFKDVLSGAAGGPSANNTLPYREDSGAPDSAGDMHAPANDFSLDINRNVEPSFRPARTSNVNTYDVVHAALDLENSDADKLGEDVKTRSRPKKEIKGAKMARTAIELTKYSPPISPKQSRSNSASATAEAPGYMRATSLTTAARRNNALVLDDPLIDSPAIIRPSPRREVSSGLVTPQDIIRTLQNRSLNAKVAEGNNELGNMRFSEGSNFQKIPGSAFGLLSNKRSSRANQEAGKIAGWIPASSSKDMLDVFKFDSLLQMRSVSGSGGLVTDLRGPDQNILMTNATPQSRNVPVNHSLAFKKLGAANAKRLTAICSSSQSVARSSSARKILESLDRVSKENCANSSKRTRSPLGPPPSSKRRRRCDVRDSDDISFIGSAQWLRTALDEQILSSSHPSPADSKNQSSKVSVLKRRKQLVPGREKDISRVELEAHVPADDGSESVDLVSRKSKEKAYMHRKPLPSAYCHDGIRKKRRYDSEQSGKNKGLPLAITAEYIGRHSENVEAGKQLHDPTAQRSTGNQSLEATEEKILTDYVESSLPHPCKYNGAGSNSGKDCFVQRGHKSYERISSPPNKAKCESPVHQVTLPNERLLEQGMLDPSSHRGVGDMVPAPDMCPSKEYCSDIGAELRRSNDIPATSDDSAMLVLNAALNDSSHAGADGAVQDRRIILEDNASSEYKVDKATTNEDTGVARQPTLLQHDHTNLWWNQLKSEPATGVKNSCSTFGYNLAKEIHGVDEEQPGTESVGMRKQCTPGDMSKSTGDLELAKCDDISRDLARSLPVGESIQVPGEHASNSDLKSITPRSGTSPAAGDSNLITSQFQSAANPIASSDHERDSNPLLAIQVPWTSQSLETKPQSSVPEDGDGVCAAVVAAKIAGTDNVNDTSRSGDCHEAILQAVEVSDIEKDSKTQPGFLSSENGATGTNKFRATESADLPPMAFDQLGRDVSSSNLVMPSGHASTAESALFALPQATGPGTDNGTHLGLYPEENMGKPERRTAEEQGISDPVGISPSSQDPESKQLPTGYNLTSCNSKNVMDASAPSGNFVPENRKLYVAATPFPSAGKEMTQHIAASSSSLFACGILPSFGSTQSTSAFALPSGTSPSMPSASVGNMKIPNTNSTVFSSDSSALNLPVGSSQPSLFGGNSSGGGSAVSGTSVASVSQDLKPSFMFGQSVPAAPTSVLNNPNEYPSFSSSSLAGFVEGTARNPFAQSQAGTPFPSSLPPPSGSTNLNSGGPLFLFGAAPSSTLPSTSQTLSHASLLTSSAAPFVSGNPFAGPATFGSVGTGPAFGGFSFGGNVSGTTSAPSFGSSSMPLQPQASGSSSSLSAPFGAPGGFINPTLGSNAADASGFSVGSSNASLSSRRRTLRGRRSFK